MASRIIYMDGVATAHLRDDGSLRIEVEATSLVNHIEQSLARIPAAIRRAVPAVEQRALELDGRPVNVPSGARMRSVAAEAPEREANPADFGLGSVSSAGRAS